MALLGRDTKVTGPLDEGVLLLETLQGKGYEIEAEHVRRVPDAEPCIGPSP